MSIILLLDRKVESHGGQYAYSFYYLLDTYSLPAAGTILLRIDVIHMSENALWEEAIEHSKWLDSARENVELMKARFNDLMLNEQEEEELAAMQNEIHILVIGTDRCNDTAGNLPVLARMASLSSRVHLRVLDSDDNAKAHQNYRVNGKRKTPVVLFLNKDNQELCRWVERPNAAYRTLHEQAGSIDDRRDFLKSLYSDPEILRQSLSELMPLLIRSDYLLQV